MSPEKLNRTIEFIIESQARLAIAQEQDRERRLEVQNLTVQVVRLVDHQSSRLDRQDEFYRDSLKQNGEFQNKTLERQDQMLQLQGQALHLLHLILDRLPPAPPAH